MTKDEEDKANSGQQEQHSTEKKTEASSSSASGDKQAGDSKDGAKQEGGSKEAADDEATKPSEEDAPGSTVVTPETPQPKSRPLEPMTDGGGSVEAPTECPATPASVATANSEVQRRSQRRRRRGYHGLPEGFPIKPPGMPGFGKPPPKPDA